jgi:hypothetical protein
LKVAALDLRRQLIIASLHVQNVMFLFEVRASGDRLKKLELCFYNNLFSTCTRAKSYTIPWVDLLSMFVKRICEPVLLVHALTNILQTNVNQLTSRRQVTYTQIQLALDRLAGGSVAWTGGLNPLLHSLGGEICYNYDVSHF